MGYSRWAIQVHRHATAMIPSTFKAFRGGTRRRHNITDPREFNALAALFHHGHMAVGIAQCLFIAMQPAAFFFSCSSSSFLHLPSLFPLLFRFWFALSSPTQKMTLKPTARMPEVGELGQCEWI